VPGNDGEKWVYWQLPRGTNIQEFWEKLGLDNNGLALLDDMSHVDPQAVCVDIVNGRPFGSLLKRLSVDRRSVKALFIAMYGGVNANPCQCCHEHYRCHLGGLSQNSHCLEPFEECRSIPHFSPSRYQAKCCNCAFRAKNCVYQHAEGTVYDCWVATGSGRDTPAGADGNDRLNTQAALAALRREQEQLAAVRS
jgi:hypothetical protein